MINRILLFIIILVFIWIYIRYFERRSIFYPTKQIEITPKDIGFEFEEVYFKTSDGILLNGWFIPAKDGRITILFCHGNAGNISHRLDLLEILAKLNLNLFLFDYRGYGKSQGSPSEKGTYEDAVSAYKYLLTRKDVNKDKIVVFGESLGGAIAIDLATKEKQTALICESTFTSAVDMAKAVYPMMPVHLILTIKYDALSKIKNVDCPKLIMHSKNDEIVPFEQGKRLFEAAKEPKELFIMQGSHNEAKFIRKEEFSSRIKAFLDKFLK